MQKECLSEKFIKKYQSKELYQYTTIDKYSRYRISCEYCGHNTHVFRLLLCQITSAFKVLNTETECIQADNSPEFTRYFCFRKKITIIYSR